MKSAFKHPISSRSIVDSVLGALIVRPIKYGVLVSRVGDRLIRDGAKTFESYLVTGVNYRATLNSIGIVGVGKKSATFFCDQERTQTQLQIIQAAWSSRFAKGAA